MVYGGWQVWDVREAVGKKQEAGCLSCSLQHSLPWGTSILAREGEAHPHDGGSSVTIT